MAPVAVRRTFDVAVPLRVAWDRLAQIERWPEWAPHITHVTVSPPGTLGPASSGALHIRYLGRNTYRMTAWDPPSGWEWTGGLPGVHICYDHRFEAAGEDVTTLTFAVSLEGPLSGLARPVFSRVYGRLIDRAIPRLQRWILT
jgi:hypothetical protein